MDMYERMQTYALVVSRLRADAIESTCERMLTTPDSPGVMVGLNAAWLDPRVPFGEIWYVEACADMDRSQ